MSFGMIPSSVAFDFSSAERGAGGAVSVWTQKRRWTFLDVEAAATIVVGHARRCTIPIAAAPTAAAAKINLAKDVLLRTAEREPRAADANRRQECIADGVMVAV